jgi:hypothetical protein
VVVQLVFLSILYSEPNTLSLLRESWSFPPSDTFVSRYK